MAFETSLSGPGRTSGRTSDVALAIPGISLPPLPSTIIDGHCAEHGPYTRQAWIQAGAVRGCCPECLTLERAAARLRERETWLREIFPEQSGIPRRFLDNGFETFQAETPEQKSVKRTLLAYAENFPEHAGQGRGLVLYGATGTGKTHLACAALRRIAGLHGQGGRYATACGITRDIKACYRNNGCREAEVIDSYTRPALLVIDEVGVQFGSDTEKLLLFEVVNGRYGEMRPTILIANLDLPEFATYLGDRVMDRMRENGGAALAFTWGSRRAGR